MNDASPLRVEDARLLRGRARFTDDVHLDRMVHAVFVRSPMAHAKIGGIDAEPALAAGALAVITAENLPFIDKKLILRYWNPNIRGGLPSLLAADRVRHVGEAVALVIAENRYVAEDIAVLVAVAIKIVGALLITAMLIIPAAAARSMSRTPESMAVIAAIVGLCSIISGLSASFYWNTPTGPTMIVAAIVLFVLTSLWSVVNRGR